MSLRDDIEPKRVAAAGKLGAGNAPTVVVMRWLPNTVPIPMATAAIHPNPQGISNLSGTESKKQT